MTSLQLSFIYGNIKNIKTERCLSKSSVPFFMMYISFQSKGSELNQYVNINAQNLNLCDIIRVESSL